MEEDFYQNLVDAIEAADILPLKSRIDLIEGATNEQEKRRKLEEENQHLRENNELLASLLPQQQANLDNRTESVDVSGGKEDAMYKHRGRIETSDGEIKEFTGKTHNDFAQKIWDAAIWWYASKGMLQQPQKRTDEGPTFKEYAEQVLRAGVLKSFERGQDNGYLKNWIIPQMGHKPIKSITFSECQEFAKWLSETPSPNTRKTLSQKTAKHILGALSAILNNAVRDEIISRNPCEGVKNRNPKPEKRYRLLKNEEQLAIIRTLPTIAEENVRLFLAIAFSTGMRPEEICALQWEDYCVDNEGRPFISVTKAVRWQNVETPTIKDPKTENGHRNVPIMYDGAVAILNDSRKADGYIIRGTKTNKDGTNPIGNSQLTTIYDIFNKHLMGKGIEKRFTGYDLRHTMATILNNVGATPKSYKSIMGHADEDFTQRMYMHSSWEQVLEDAQKVSDHFSSLIESQSDSNCNKNSNEK